MLLVDDAGTAFEEIDAALDEAIDDIGLGSTVYGKRLKQLFLNRLKDQYREEDLVDLLAEMPITEEDV